MTGVGQSFLETGVQNLGVVLGGGGGVSGDTLLVVGPPGSGKTTLAFQLAFHAATPGSSSCPSTPVRLSRDERRRVRR